MFPYLFVFFSTMLLAFLKDIRQFSKFKFFISFLIIFSLSILYYYRDYSIGLDTYTYVGMIEDVTLLDDFGSAINYALNYHVEIGFILYLYFLSFFANAHFIFFITVIIIYSNLNLTLNKFKVNSLLYYAAFFSYCGVFLWSFNILRQMVAISFVMLAVSYLLNNKTKIFFLFILIASFFHYSSVVCLFIYFLFNNNSFLYKYRFFLVVFIFSISSFILNYISSIYVRYENYSEGDVANSIGYVLFSFYLFIYLFLGGAIVNFKKMINEFKLFVNIFSIYIGLQLSFLVTGVSNFGTTRIVLYFLWPSIFIIGIFLVNINNRNTRYLVNLFLFLFLTFYFIFILNSAGYDYIPFKFFHSY